MDELKTRPEAAVAPTPEAVQELAPQINTAEIHVHGLEGHPDGCVCCSRPEALAEADAALDNILGTAESSQAKVDTPEQHVHSENCGCDTRQEALDLANAGLDDILGKPNEQRSHTHTHHEHTATTSVARNEVSTAVHNHKEHDKHGEGLCGCHSREEVLQEADQAIAEILEKNDFTVQDQEKQSVVEVENLEAQRQLHDQNNNDTPITQIEDRGESEQSAVLRAARDETQKIHQSQIESSAVESQATEPNKVGDTTTKVLPTESMIKTPLAENKAKPQIDFEQTMKLPENDLVAVSEQATVTVEESNAELVTVEQPRLDAHEVQSAEVAINQFIEAYTAEDTQTLHIPKSVEDQFMSVDEALAEEGNTTMHNNTNEAAAEATELVDVQPEPFEMPAMFEPTLSVVESPEPEITNTVDSLFAEALVSEINTLEKIEENNVASSAPLELVSESAPVTIEKHNDTTFESELQTEESTSVIEMIEETLSQLEVNLPEESDDQTFDITSSEAPAKKLSNANTQFGKEYKQLQKQQEQLIKHLTDLALRSGVSKELCSQLEFEFYTLTTASKRHQYLQNLIKQIRDNQVQAGDRKTKDASLVAKQLDQADSGKVTLLSRFLLQLTQRKNLEREYAA